MCDTCGCTQPDDAVTLTKPGKINSHKHISSNHNQHSHSHNETHTHSHHDHSHSKKINIETDILHKNDLIAERNRGYFEAKNIKTLNLVSSPGSGKTSLLEKTLSDLKEEKRFYVIEGDQQTMNDANRIDSVGVPVIQVNTGNGCHLDSNMVSAAIKELNPQNDSILFIENVGNLVCPSLFDLGESKRVVIISVTEGEDKPIKYPNMFQSSDLCIINKIDLLPHLDFDLEKMKNYAVQVNHHLEFIELSVKSGEGLKTWYDWLMNLKTS